MNRRTKVLAAFFLFVALLIGWPVGSHYRAQWRLSHFRRELKARGEKLEIVELIPKLPLDDNNGARELMGLTGHLPSAPALSSNYPPPMRHIPPARALIAWQQEILPTLESTNVWLGLNAAMAANQGTLEGIRRALEKPTLIFELNYRLGFNVLLGHLTRMKSTAQFLSAATLLDLHEDRFAAAWEHLLALNRIVARFKDEPLMISELVRLAIANIALNTSWEALQSTQWEDRLLQELQVTWESVDYFSQAESALSMERAMGAKTYDAARQSYAAISAGAFPGAGASSGLAELAQLGKEVLDNPKEGLSNMARRYPGYWGWKLWQSYDDEIANAQLCQAALEAIRAFRKTHALAAARKEFDQAATHVRQSHPRAGAWLGLSLGSEGVVERFLSRVSSAEIQRALLVTAIQLKRYQVHHREIPDELAVLVPDFASQVPRDPINGEPLRYRTNSDGSFLLYSIGDDAVDNGGDTTMPETVAGSGTYRQWWKARDAVWPSPAGPEEIQTYFAKLAADRKTVKLSAPASPRFLERYGLATTNAR